MTESTDLAAQFNENFIEKRVTFPYKSSAHVNSEDCIISCNLMMDNTDYTEAVADITCPSNENSSAFYIYLKVRGAIIAHAEDGLPVLTKSSKQGELITSYNIAVAKGGNLHLSPLHPCRANNYQAIEYK